jgi:hypothetical protein
VFQPTFAPIRHREYAAGASPGGGASRTRLVLDGGRILLVTSRQAPVDGADTDSSVELLHQRAEELAAIGVVADGVHTGSQVGLSRQR